MKSSLISPTKTSRDSTCSSTSTDAKYRILLASSVGSEIGSTPHSQGQLRVNPARSGFSLFSNSSQAAGFIKIAEPTRADIPNLLNLDKSLVIGEEHDATLARKFLIDKAPQLAENGFTTLYLEGLPSDKKSELYKDLENFNKTGIMSAKLENYIAEFDDGWKVMREEQKANKKMAMNDSILEGVDISDDRSKYYGIADVMRAFQQQGIRIVGIEPPATSVTDYDPVGSNYLVGSDYYERKLRKINRSHSRLMELNNSAQEIIAQESKFVPKFVCLAGKNHVATTVYHGHIVKGIAERTGAVSMVVIDRDKYGYNNELFLYTRSAVVETGDKDVEQMADLCIYAHGVDLAEFVRFNDKESPPLASESGAVRDSKQKWRAAAADSLELSSSSTTGASAIEADIAPSSTIGFGSSS